MGKMIGGPLDGKPAGKAIIEQGSRYNVIPLGDDIRSFPRAIYERVRGTDDFTWVNTFENEEEYGVWGSVNPNSHNYF